jgi:GNAT superfamily N-acetyltransferase
MDIEIKHFETITDDLVELFKLLNNEMNEHSPLRVKYREDCFHDLKDMTDAFIAYDGESAIGCAILVRKNEEVGIVTNIYVAPDYRRHGLCYKLFDEVEARAKARGHIILVGDTWKELVPMQRAWIKGGFTEYKIIPTNSWEEEYYNSGHNYWKLLL